MSSMSSMRSPSGIRSRILDAVNRACAMFGDIVKEIFSQGLPTTPAELLELELKIHRDVSTKCVDAVVSAIIVEAHNSSEIAAQEAIVAGRIPHLRLQKSVQEVTITLYGGSAVTLKTRYYLARPPVRRARSARKASAASRVAESIANSSAWEFTSV